MTEYLIQDTTLTGLADKIRILSGTSDAMGTDAMGTKLGSANTEVDIQTDLIDQIKVLLVALGAIIEPEADTLDGCSWANIDALAAAGKAQNFFAVGDCKAISVRGVVGTIELDTTYLVYIIGFNHNGTTGTMDFGTFKTLDGIDVCLVDSKLDNQSTDGTKYFNMNHSSSNPAGGWKGCDLRYDILGSTNIAPSRSSATNYEGYDATEDCATNPIVNTLMAALPDDLRNVMKPMEIYTNNRGSGNDASYVTSSIDYLPLLAEYEIFGERTYANSTEQTYQSQYEYYSNGNSTVKREHSDTDSAADWITRSTDYSSSSFSEVWTDGSCTYGYSAAHSQGIAPIFRVGAAPAA